MARVAPEKRAHHVPAKRQIPMVNKRKTGGLLMEFYTYVWRDSAGVPFYVGKGKGKRSRSTTNRSKEFKQVYAQGGCTVEIVDWFIHESQAHAHEVELIERYGRRDIATGSLVNKTDGGEGASGIILTRSAEMRAKISASLTGKTLSEETRAKMSAASRGRPKSAKHRANISAGKSNPSTEKRERQSIAQRAIWGDPAIRRRHSDLMLSSEISEARSMRLRHAGPKASNKSGFKGVSFNGEKGKWGAFMKAAGKCHKFLGWFADASEAALAYDRAAYAVWGSDCYRNFPDKIGGNVAA